MRALTLSFLLITSAATAQVFTHSAMPISKENKSNVFPLFHSTTRPHVATVINRVLQMNSFQHTNVEKNPTAYEDTMRSSSWSFSVDYTNDRAVKVQLNQFFLKHSMGGSPYTETTYYWFDALTGDPFESGDFISPQGAEPLKALVKTRLDPLIRQQHALLMQKYPPSKFPGVIPDLNKSLEMLKGNVEYSFPNCINQNFDAGKRSFTIFAYWEYVDADAPPELGDSFSVTLSSKDVQPFSSDFWSYYITRTSQTIPQRDAISHVWSGFIGEKIPVTIMLKSEGDKLKGTEVYDNYGGAIVLAGTLTGNSFQFMELSEIGKAVAVFEGTVDNGKLSGVWKKADGSKTLSFRATAGVAQ